MLLITYLLPIDFDTLKAVTALAHLFSLNIEGSAVVTESFLLVRALLSYERHLLLLEDIVVSTLGRGGDDKKQLLMIDSIKC
jgi:hypothetical protein